MKRCGKCRVEKPFSEFHKNRSNKDGHSGRCKECRKAYFGEDGARREKRVNQQKRWYQANRSRRAKRMKAYHEENKEKTRKQQKVYQSTIEGRFSMIRSVAKRRGKEFKLAIEDVKTLWNKPCEYCGEEIEGLHLDRVDNKKGYEVGNVVSCCWPCNKSKRGKVLGEQWIPPKENNNESL